MQKKKVVREEMFTLLTAEELENVQGGEKNFWERMRETMVDIFIGKDNGIKL